MNITTVTEKGQATIPLPIRNKLGLKPGQKVIFEEKGQEVVIKKVPLLSQLRGSLKSQIKYSDKKANKAIEKMFIKEYGKVG